jgi:predicted transcriptional regulator
MVRVDDKIHETLQRLSKVERRPISQIVGELVEQYDKKTFWNGMKEDYERLRADPEAWSDYQKEAEEWSSKTGDPLADEPPYYTPEEEEEIRAYAKSQGW